jgi:hypothetical protein
MSRWQITISSDAARKRACDWVSKAPDGYRVTVQSVQRTKKQNDRQWPMLSAISTQLVWHGRKYTPEQWRDYFMHQLNGGAFMPDEDGGMIPIGRSSSNLGKEEHSFFQELIEAFAERNGVDLMGQERAA